METLTPIPENLLSADAKEQRQRKIRSEAGKRLDEHTKVLPELEVGDHVQLQNLRGRHPLQSDQAGVVTSKNGFSNYSVKVSGSGLVTKRNRATLRKMLPTVQTEKLLFGQGQRADKAEQVGQPVDPGHSRAAGGGPVSRPVVTSHPVIAPGAAPAEGSVVIDEDSLVVTPAPAQGVSEQRAQPVLVGTEKGLDSQVDLSLLGQPDSDVPLRRGTRVRVQPDRYGS